MIWRVFRRSPSAPAPEAAWWRDADALADAPDAAAIAALRDQAPGGASLDDVEQREEMIEGLEQLAALAAAATLPSVDTQHRVIGADTCHLMTPATLAGEQPVPGKVFVTDRRLVFAGGRARSWAWHRVRDARRDGRVVTLILAGPAEAVSLHCNTYGDAIVIRHLARRLGPPATPAT